MDRNRRMTRKEVRELLHRRRYLIPNAVTVGNMFCGFLAIIYATSARYEQAVIAILIAILLDGLDGRVARRLNATSKFGIEFDSFSDVISFGFAPAILIYQWCFRVPADEFGVAVCFFYALCAASRLARFNISTENLKSFTGLPTPGAAVFVAAVVNFAPRAEATYTLSVIGTLTMLSIGYLMVSTIPFSSIKEFKISRMRPWARLGLGLLIALIWYNSKVGILVLALAYVASGPFMVVRNRTSSGDPEDQLPDESAADNVVVLSNRGE